MLQKVAEAARVRIISDDLEALRKVKATGKVGEGEEAADAGIWMEGTIYRDKVNADKALWILQGMTYPTAEDLEEAEEGNEEGEGDNQQSGETTDGDNQQSGETTDGESDTQVEP